MNGGRVTQACGDAVFGHAATGLRDIAVPPGNRLEELKGKLRGQHRIRINEQWRICFRWASGAHSVRIIDYH
jgi:proteic killer suppression protein